MKSKDEGPPGKSNASAAWRNSARNPLRSPLPSRIRAMPAAAVLRFFENFLPPRTRTRLYFFFSGKYFFSIDATTT